MKTMGLLIVSVLLALAMAAGGCGPQKDPPATGPSAAPGVPSAAVVKMTGWMKFDPAKITVNVGDTVEWKNTSIVVHTVTADPKKAADTKHVALPEGAELFDSGNISAGKTFTHTFTVPGTYKYFCIPHEKMGMVGEVEVKAAPAK